MSCEGQVTLVDDVVSKIEGFTCERGQKYAAQEVIAPERILTTTVRVEGGELPLLPVMSQRGLPKAKILACAKELTKCKVAAPVNAGDIVWPDILGLGVDIVATRDIACH
jgi:CxxC motif-containing protein